MHLEEIVHGDLLQKLKIDKKHEGYSVIILAKERIEPNRYDTSMKKIKEFLDEAGKDYKSRPHYGMVSAKMSGKEIRTMANALYSYIDRIAENEQRLATQ